MILVFFFLKKKVRESIYQTGSEAGIMSIGIVELRFPKASGDCY